MYSLFCKIHPKQEYTFICQSHDDCQKKFCTSCLNEHCKNSLERIEFTSVENFRNQILDEMFTPKYDDNGLNKLMDEFKNNISKIQIFFQMLIEHLTNKFFVLWGHAHSLTTEFQNYKQNLMLREIEYFSKEEICEISKLLLSNSKFQKLQEHQKKCHLVLCQINDAIVKQMSKVKQKIDRFASNSEIFEEVQYNGQSWRLEGEEIFGLKHGKFCYKNNFGKIQQIEAGEFNFNLKHGKWFELSNQYESIYVRSQLLGEYFLGKKQGRWDTFYKDQLIGGGNYDQEGKKQGLWIEYFNENLNDPNLDSEPIICTGIYENGVRKGEWRIIQILEKQTIDNDKKNGNQIHQTNQQLFRHHNDDGQFNKE